MIPEKDIPFSDLSVFRLAATNEVKSFKCRTDRYTRFLKQEAIEAMDECTGCTHIVRYKDGILVGYFTLINDVIFGDRIEESDLKPGFRYDTYPALKIARLATHRDWEGLNIGTFMLMQSVAYAFKINQLSACRFITVDAVNNKVGFYKKFGFVIIEEETDDKTTAMYFNHTAIRKRILEQEKQTTL